MNVLFFTFLNLLQGFDEDIFFFYYRFHWYCETQVLLSFKNFQESFHIFKGDVQNQHVSIFLFTF